ncbi:MAG: U32 family peptidase [Oscillospiraceae bacterium]
MIEILSPAGSNEALEAAVKSGATAVYLGAALFNARRNAQNFADEQSLCDAIKYCHSMGVKVYLTLNTLVSDEEKSTAVELAISAAKAGIDAFIVQDLGLAKLLHQALPGVSLHASTQMSIHSPSPLPILKQLGFKRVVVAREMDKERLGIFCAEAAKLKMEVEVFVHGALCMSLSGQCYLSAILGSRSGNRGLCAQPCRLPFKVENGGDYDLSLKDLSLIRKISELQKMGVTSLKIEGRMKRPEYVAAATAACRAAIVNDEKFEDIYSLLSNVFSRGGFTDGYFENKLGKQMFGMRTAEDAQMSASVIKQTHEFYRLQSATIPLNMSLSVLKNAPSRLTVINQKIKVTAEGEIPQAAREVSSTFDSCKAQLSKLGGTAFYLDSFECEIDDGLILPASQLNALRREAVNLLELKMLKLHEIVVNKPQYTMTKSIVKRNPQILAKFKCATQIPENTSNIAAICVPLESDLKNLKVSVPKIVDIPRGIMGNESEILQMLKTAKTLGFSAACCGNLAAISLCQEAEMLPIADFGMNIYNSDSLDSLQKMQVAASVVSFESTVGQINSLGTNLPRGIIAYGKLPVMMFRNCPNRNVNGCGGCGGISSIVDRKDMTFKIACRNGFSELYNPHPLYVLDRLEEFRNLDFIVLSFFDEPKSECAKIIAAALNGSAPDGEYTRGLYYRGVQ